MYKIGVIGCGHWGPNHVRVLNNHDESTVTIMADPDARQLQRMSRAFPGVEVTTDYRKVLDNAVVDAVVIATPTQTHYQLAHEALEHGKHVLCEKPLCENAGQACALVDLARQRNLILMTGHVFLFNPGITRIKQLVDDGELGQVYYVCSKRTNLGPVRSDVNVVYDLASHDVSIFNWLFGHPPLSASATGTSFLQPGIEDVAFMTLKYPGDICASIEASWLNPQKVRQMTVVGASKMITWDDLDLSTPLAIYDKRATVEPVAHGYGEFLRVSTWEGEVRLPKVTWEEPLKKQDHYFLECLARGRCEKSDGAFAHGVVATVEAIAGSIKAGGTPIKVIL